MLHYLPFFRDDFEFAREPKCSFSGVILGHSQGQNAQEEPQLNMSDIRLTLPRII